MTAHLEAAALIGLCAAGLVAVVIITRYAIRLERRITRMQSELDHMKEARKLRVPYDLKEAVEGATFLLGRLRYETDQNQALIEAAQRNLNRAISDSKEK